MNCFFEDSLKHAKILLQNFSCIHEFSEYARGYIFTTEYINRYLRQNEFNNGKALTILASGDHVFNLVLYDVFDIDTIDINRLNYFTFWLKFAFILNLSFNEFKCLEKIISRDSYLPCFLEFLERSKSCMPLDVYLYFKKLVYFEYSLKKYNGLRNLFLPVYHSLFPSNSYLQNEKLYNELKRKLEKLNIKMYFQDIKTVTNILKGNYDIALLSNVSDYLGTENEQLTLDGFNDYINSFLSLLNNDGLIINYLYGLRRKYVIQNSSITLNDLGKDNVIKLTNSFNSEGYYRVRKR